MWYLDTPLTLVPVIPPQELVFQDTNASVGDENKTTNIVGQIWSKDLHDGGRAIVFFNRAEHTRNMSVPLSVVNSGTTVTGAFVVYDVWNHESVTITRATTNCTGSCDSAPEHTVSVDSHGVVVLRVSSGGT